MNGFPPGMPMMPPGYGGRMHHEPMFPHQQPMGQSFRPLAGPNGIPMYPGMNGVQQMPQQQRVFAPPHGPPGFPQQLQNGLGGIGQGFGGQKEPVSAQTHSRHQSASFDKSSFEALTQPIARPAPIGRPSSVVQGQRESSHQSSNDVDDLSNHLGSSALLDDSDEPLTSSTGTRRSSAAPGPMSRQSFTPSTPFSMSSMDSSAFGANPMSSYNTWGGGPPNPFGTSSLPGGSYMGGWGSTNNSGFSSSSTAPGRPSQPRSVGVRLMLCQACRNLAGSTRDGFYDIDAIRGQIERINPLREEPVFEKELLEICETEGNSHNGGGVFDVQKINDRTMIRYESDLPPNSRPAGAPGDIGSPVVGGGGLSRFLPGISAPGGF